jgi:hypothetical protein
MGPTGSSETSSVNTLRTSCKTPKPGNHIRSNTPGKNRKQLHLLCAKYKQCTTGKRKKEGKKRKKEVMVVSQSERNKEKRSRNAHYLVTA